uniref:Uncharacterized protein n=1 Tax=Pavo cristatus TaxID=9049 RepID=A0A8C9EUV5_PAVCR
ICPEGRPNKELLPQGLRKDDTVLNRVQLHCSHGEDLYGTHTAESQSKVHWCPHRGHQEGFALQAQVLQHWLLPDEVAATSTCFACSNRQVLEGLCSGRGQWGSWSSWCPREVCGTQKQRESVQCWKGVTWP